MSAAAATAAIVVCALGAVAIGLCCIGLFFGRRDNQDINSDIDWDNVNGH